MKKEKSKATSFRLSLKVIDILERLSKDFGISKTAVIEVAIRAMANKQGVDDV